MSLLAVRVRLKVFGYKSFENSPIKINSLQADVNPQKIATSVEYIARFVPGALCLAQAITAQRHLAKLGFETTMRIGVKSDVGCSLKAHAWLLWQGIVILGGDEEELESYQVMTDMDSAVF